jgi:hypothetical protein
LVEDCPFGFGFDERPSLLSEVILIIDVSMLSTRTARSPVPYGARAQSTFDVAFSSTHVNYCDTKVNNAVSRRRSVCMVV